MLTRWSNFGNLGRFSERDFAGPFGTLDELRREMNRLIFDFERGFPDSDLPSNAVWPQSSLEDAGTALVLRAEIPGVAEKDVELTVDAGTITLKGHRAEAAPEGYSVHRKERAAQRFARSFALPVKVDAEKVEASLKNGVLTVTLPKAKEAQPRQIAVKTQ